MPLRTTPRTTALRLRCRQRGDSMQTSLTEFVTETRPVCPPDAEQPDEVRTVGRSVIQHGPLNDRVYLMKVDPDEAPQLIRKVYGLAEEHGYSKLFAKVPQKAIPLFTQHGFTKEACVPGMQNGDGDICFMSRFLRLWRQKPADSAKMRSVLQIAAAKPPLPPSALPAGYELQEMRPRHTREMAALYARVFPSYPFPIHEPDYLEHCMKNDVRFFGAMAGDGIAALASAEMDTAHANAEMTDFATLPAHRGKRLARHLLAHMEKALPENGIRTAYTIARAVSAGMNVTFARCGYRYAGTLVNNTNIAGRIESMNVWFRQLA